MFKYWQKKNTLNKIWIGNMGQGLYRRLVNDITNEVVWISLSGHGDLEGDILIFVININFFLSIVLKFIMKWWKI